MKAFKRCVISLALCCSIILALIPFNGAKAEENAATVTSTVLTKDKSAKKITLKGTYDTVELKKGITVKSLLVAQSAATINAGTDVTVDNLNCKKKGADVTIEALKGSKITVNLKKKTRLTIKGSRYADVTVNVLCKGCTLICDIPVSVNASYTFKSGTAEQNISDRDAKLSDINWWKEAYADDEIIKTAEEIEAFNKQNFGNGCGLKNILSYEDITDLQVVEMIKEYSFPSKEYTDGRKITQEETDKIRDNRNISDYPDNEETAAENAAGKKLTVRYAITTENASIRAFPTDLFLTNEIGKYDYLQETGINYFEPLIVLWDSADGEWSFVQAYDYNGWMKKSSFGYCERDELVSLIDTLKDKNVWCTYYTDTYQFVGVNGKEYALTLRMGTYLPVKDDKTVLAYRSKDGNATFTFCSPEDDDKGGKPIEFTSKNLLTIAGNALGTPYSWGDISEKGMDCSSTLQGIFKCFGIYLPRNSSQQIKLSADIIDLNTGFEKKLKKITSLPMGSVLYMPGHVMLYLGEYNGVPYILHNTTDSARDDSGTTIFNSCVLTSIDIGKSGYTLFDRITYAVSFK